MIHLTSANGLKIDGACVAVLLSRGPDKRAQIVAVFANETMAGAYAKRIAERNSTCAISLLHLAEDDAED